MRIILILLLVSLVSVSAEDLSSAERRWVLEMIAPARDLAELRQNYLDDPNVSPDIKQAIEQRIVIVGMCPLEAVAAAGPPRWGAIHHPSAAMPNIEFPVSIAVQCARPEKETGVQLEFRNDTQFGPQEVFRVCFWEGRSVAVDQNKPNPACLDEI